MPKAHIILLPGAWHDPSSMSGVSSSLQLLGYTVHALQMPAVGSSNPPKDLSEDIAALQAMVDKAIGDSNDVFVICHSWGGMVAGSALMGYSKTERARSGKEGGVVRVGYLAAFMVSQGVSLKDAVGGEWPDWFNVQVILFTSPSGYLFARSVQGIAVNASDRAILFTPTIEQSFTMTSPKTSKSAGSRHCIPKP